MNEKQTLADEQTTRPTKKQKELLAFIEQFIGEHGFSPSYREIMNGLQYTSVATVALHVNNLIKRGHLVKREHSARSLEVLTHVQEPLKITNNQVEPGDEKWLVEKVEHMIGQLEQATDTELKDGVDQLYVVVGAMKILGLEAAATSFGPRLSALKKRVPTE